MTGAVAASSPRSRTPAQQAVLPIGHKHAFTARTARNLSRYSAATAHRPAAGVYSSPRGGVARGRATPRMEPHARALSHLNQSAGDSYTHLPEHAVLLAYARLSVCQCCAL
jgi:hypothetical protein